VKSDCVLEAVDLFCGAGGTSSGIIKAVTQNLHRRLNLIAVNHWRTAINTHSLNHPSVRHLCEPVENLHPLDLIRSRHLHLLGASCECRFHSIARGGGACNEQSRAQPWQLIRWATDIRVDNIMMENVKEFQDWCPLLNKGIQYKGRYYKKGRPDPRLKGQSFRAFVAALRGLGYTVEWRVQVAADYGDPTSRERLILQARLGQPVYWPEPTHGPGRGKPYRTARECIDWSIKGTSIFERKQLGLPPLCESTLQRIAAGLRKFGGKNAEAFLVMLNGTSDRQINTSAKSLDEPLPTVAGTGSHFHLVEPEPFILPHRNFDNMYVDSVDKPMRTVTAQSNDNLLVEPIIVRFDQKGSTGSCSTSVDAPLPTIVTKQNMLLVEPVGPFVMPITHHGDDASRCKSVDQPAPTLTGARELYLIEPMVMKYYKTGRCKKVTQPMDTITTKARFLLVECEKGERRAYDIRTRMVQPHELAACHSFPKDYKFTGNQKDQTMQIGNSVPVELACAHATSILQN